MTRGSALDIARHETAAGDVVGLRGELDLTNSRQLEDALAAAPSRAVILDLGGLAFLDSAGIRTIDRARRRFHEAGRQLLVVAPPESRAGWTFRIAGLTDDTVLASIDVAKSLAASSNGAG